MRTIHINYAILVFILLLFSSCEKTIYTEEEKEDIENNEGTDDEPENSIDTDQAQFMSIAEAQQAEDGEVIWMTGYIIGSCQRYMKNADFTEPFEGSSAIILADSMITDDSDVYYTDENLFPVCLTTYSSIRAGLNLEDNPQLWNRRIFLVGIKGRYFSRDGIKTVLDYAIK